MKKAYIKSLVIIILTFSNLNGQVYEFAVQTDTHRIIKDKTYLWKRYLIPQLENLNLQEEGFTLVKKLDVDFEFNSNFKNDSIKKMLYTNTKNGRKFLHQNKSFRGNG